MVDVATYAELGERVDRAVTARARAGTYISQKGLDGLKTMLSVKFVGATWADGSQQLSVKLEELVRARLAELVNEAMAALDDEAEAARIEMASRITPPQPAKVRAKA